MTTYTIEEVDAACRNILGTDVYDAMNKNVITRPLCLQLAAAHCFIDGRDTDHAVAILRQALRDMAQYGHLCPTEESSTVTGRLTL